MKTDKKLSSFMMTSLIVVGIGTLATVMVLLFGNFEGKVIRTVSTLVLFAAFTIFSAIDSTRNAPNRYLLIGQVGHMYMLGLSLIMIWGSAIDRKWIIDEFSILTDMLIIIAMVKAAIYVVQRVSDGIATSHVFLPHLAKVCAIFVILTGLLYTLPIGTDFILRFSEPYWRVAVTVMVFAACLLSMTILIAYFLYHDNEKAPQKSAQDTSNNRSFAQPLSDNRVVQRVSPSTAPASNGTLPTGSSLPTEYLKPVSGPQPWPVFPNGQPLPAAANGRPDYAVLQYVASVHAEAERQWFGQ